MGLGRGVDGDTRQPHNHLLPAAPAIHGGTEDLAEEVMATINSTVRFNCKATGHPVPAVSWLWNDVPVVAGPRHQLLEGGMVLQVSVLLDRVAVLGTQETLGGRDRALFPPQGGAALVLPQQLLGSGQPSGGLCSSLAGGEGGGRRHWQLHVCSRKPSRVSWEAFCPHRAG